MPSSSPFLPGASWGSKNDAVSCYRCDFKFTFLDKVGPLSRKRQCCWCGKVFCPRCVHSVTRGDGAAYLRCAQCSLPVIFRCFKLSRRPHEQEAWEAQPFFTIWSFLTDEERDALIHSSSRLRFELPLANVDIVHSICSVFPTYFPGAEVGKGGFGRVFQCRDWRSGREDRVVLKCITKIRNTELADVETMQKEVDILRDIAGHANVVQLKEIFQTRTQLVMVMGACEGQTADKVAGFCRRNGLINALVAHMILSVSGALDDIYQTKRIVHRDVKAANIAFSADYSEVSLLDFGLAERVSGEGTQEFAAVGTSFFCPPNTWFANSKGFILVTGEDLHKGDTYSLGVTAYFILTGKYLYTLPQSVTATDVRLLLQTVKAGFDMREANAVSPEAGNLISRMVSYFPADRPTHAEIQNHPFILLHVPRVGEIVELRRRELNRNADLLEQFIDVAPRRSSSAVPAQNATTSGAVAPTAAPVAVHLGEGVQPSSP